MNDPVACLVLRCARQAEMYIYLRADLTEDDIPEALRQRTGTLSLAMELELHPGRTLARADVNEVINKLRDDGFYLQMPPQLDGGLYFGD